MGVEPWEARARAARVQTAGEDLWWWWVVVLVAATPNYRKLASPDRGKYRINESGTGSSWPKGRAMASELAGFGRNFRAGMHSMVTNNLAFKSGRL